MRLEGFDRTAIGWLDELPGWTPDQYDARKQALAVGLARPGRDLITELADRLDADLTVAARSSVSPLHRDLRFAPKGSARYKDHLLLTTWEGGDKKTSPILWVRVDARRVGFASGIGFRPEVRDRWRSAVGGDAGTELAELLADLVASHDAEIAGDQVKKVPAPFGADHPRADLLRRTGFQVRFADRVPESVGSPDIAGWCVQRLEELLPVHRWLVTRLMKG